MEFADWPGATAAARLRRPGTPTLQRAHRAILATGCRRQSTDLPALQCRAIFPHAAPPGAPSMAQAADRVHAKEHAAPSGSELRYRSADSTAFSTISPR